MTDKHISQLVSNDGKPLAAATSAPGCFIHDGVPVAKHPTAVWGNVFSEPTYGNKVDFYVTGQEYFEEVAAAILTAKKSVFITGWQVNFDVELIPGMTLYQCLEKAIDANDALRVYVMPWLSPKVGVDTGDFETMLAIFQLNAGKKAPTRAYALPAIGQSDMAGGLAIGFSHHQKLVVIDEERAFVGGIDLAYGRRDDGKFGLAASGRVGNELYNTCVPATHELTMVEQTKFLTRAELLAACFEGGLASTATFITSAPMKPIARIGDALGTVNDARKDAQKYVGDLWTNADLMPEFVGKLQDIPIDIAQDVSRWAYHKLDVKVQGKLERLRNTASMHVASAASALTAWLNNATLEEVPEEMRSATGQLIETFAIATLSYLGNVANERTKRYANLQKLGKILPASGKVIADDQPRMPWHDVHSSITGPSVHDLSKNFIRRWNGIAQRYENSYAGVTNGPAVKAVFSALGLKPLAGISVPRMAPPAKPTEKTGTSWVQVLRSAPSTMQKDEAAGNDRGGAKAPVPLPQNNCLKAMLTAIHSAQKFIYIEGQFFQSAYGEDLPRNADLSGPMSALLDITASPDYEKHARKLNIFGVPPAKILSSIRLSQIDNVRADIKGGGHDFMNDLHNVLKNLASIQASKFMGFQQKGIVNPIGDALAQRIEAAIYDDLPFHVYMVVPVHPEGTLNTLNIMTQLHLTMQSLVFGSDSLVNRIRRAILVAKLRTDKKMKKDDAIATVAKYGTDVLIKEAKDQWTKYLTLLNIRNWEMLGEKGQRPVTEQIYVHSKLLIADDRVAILGSANINDRSQLGARDSELAVIVRDDKQVDVKLNGQTNDPVSENVHKLRMRLWKKLFGLMDSPIPASSLAGVLDKPAAKATWEAIQKVAMANAVAYQKAFPFLAHMTGEPSSIWPTWNKETGRLEYHMPFNERFWRPDEIRDEKFTWEAATRAPESKPVGIQGFIVALPVTWTGGESNISGMNLTLLANRTAPGADQHGSTAVAVNAPKAAPETTT